MRASAARTARAARRAAQPPAQMLSAVATALAAFVVAGAMARTADGIDSGSGAGDQPVGGRLDAAAVTGGEAGPSRLGPNTTTSARPVLQELQSRAASRRNQREPQPDSGPPGVAVVCMLPVHRDDARLGAWFAANHRCGRVIVIIADPNTPEGELTTGAQGDRCGAAERAAERRQAIGSAQQQHRMQCATVNVVLPSGRGESSDNLWEKLMASWLWMARAHASGHRMLRGARWVLKLDIDGIFLPANFERLTREQGWDANATTHPWYLGHTNMWRLKGGSGPPFNTGQYALSVAAMRAVAPRLREAIAATDDQSVLDDPAFLAYKQSAGVPHMGTEDYCANAKGTHGDDLNIAVCLALVGVKATPAVDAMGREYFLPFDPRAHRWLEYAERDTAKPWRTWFWDGKTREQSLENCCAPRIAAIHGFARERTLLEWGWVIDVRARSCARRAHCCCTHEVRARERARADARHACTATDDSWYRWTIGRLRGGAKGRESRDGCCARRRAGAGGRRWRAADTHVHRIVRQV